MSAILGLSAWYHDAAAALLVDGRVVYAAQEERHSRVKHDASFPRAALQAGLERAGLRPADLDYVAYYEKPLLRFERLLETYVSVAPRGYRSFARAMPSWLRRKQFVGREIRRALPGFRGRLVFTEHHEAHAASAFFASPFESAAVLTLDGVGEWSTASHGAGHGSTLALSHAQRFPHSLGLLYSAFTYFAGFAVNADEYKLMGLAPFGEPRFTERILDTLVDLKPDGSLRLALEYFNFHHGLTMTSARFDALFGGPPRPPGAPVTQREMDLAASVQQVTEMAVLAAARHVHSTTGLKRLCLAGGVALNCVANGRVLREGPFDDLWIQPAAGDAGGALGAALFVWHQLLGRPRALQAGEAHASALVGDEFGVEEIESALAASGCRYRRVDADDALCREVAAALEQGQVVGWFQGRMEFGPRALGARSILADPRRPDMQSLINRKVKFREGFRPFAPAVLAEHAARAFEIAAEHSSPYMLLVAPVRVEHRLAPPDGESGRLGLERVRQARSPWPAVTHVDYSARLQTVARDAGLFRRLLETFHARTGCPMLVNTSFNLGWEPIVRTPREALDTFLSCDLDLLCLGPFLVSKREQPLHASVSGARPEHFFGDLLCSPCCRAELTHVEPAAWRCSGCGRSFEDDDGIPRLYWPDQDGGDIDEATERVKRFYEATPFPNYNAHDSARSLIDRSRRSRYAAQLERAIPFGADVLEVGCGTGQLANYLSLGWRRVIGSDMCLNSLRLGERFRRAQGLTRVRFVQSNLYRPAFRAERFDVVVCNGVLPALPDPERGLRELARLVRPGGHLVVGLYNRYGRLATDLRRAVFRLTRGRLRALDPVLRQRGLSDERRRAWFADQYEHPLEVKHTSDQVLRWFDELGLEFVRGIPALRLQDDGLAGSLFAPQPRGTRLERALAQARQALAAGRKEGGFFVMIGRKPGGTAPAPPERSGTAADLPGERDTTLVTA